MQKFEKWHGAGNDFVLIDSRADGRIHDKEEIVRICDRHFGIGADGLIYALPSTVADVRMRIFNADGSESEMCGNGIRCFAKFLYGKTYEQDLSVETGAGILSVHLDFDSVTVDMGEPILDAKKIPVRGFKRNNVVNEEIKVGRKTYQMTCVSMGNPHCVIFVDDLNEIDLAELGPTFEKHKIFPTRVNTEFVQVTGEDTLRMRVWERGTGITLACGTGACAAAVAAKLNNLAGRNCTVELDGGTLEISWHEDDNHVFMTGTAEKVFQGRF